MIELDAGALQRLDRGYRHASDLEPGRHPPIGVGQVHVDSREQGPAIAKEGEPAVRLALVLQYADPDEAAPPRCRIVEVEINALVPAWMVVRLAVAFGVQWARKRVGWGKGGL